MLERLKRLKARHGECRDGRGGFPGATEPCAAGVKAGDVNRPPRGIEPTDQFDHLALGPARVETGHHGHDGYRSAHCHLPSEQGKCQQSSEKAAEFALSATVKPAPRVAGVMRVETVFAPLSPARYGHDPHTAAATSRKRRAATVGACDRVYPRGARRRVGERKSAGSSRAGGSPATAVCRRTARGGCRGTRSRAARRSPAC